MNSPENHHPPIIQLLLVIWSLEIPLFLDHLYFFSFFPFLKTDFIYLFLDRGEGREERDRSINVWLPLTRPLLGTQQATQACALTGNPARDPLVLRPVLSPLTHTSQDNHLYFLMPKPRNSATDIK